MCGPRARETGPRRGTWTELLIPRVDRASGADATYTRWTFADRRYVSLAHNPVFANRYLLQEVCGDAPVYELFSVQTSFKEQEGLGGSSTVRGVQKDRYVGPRPSRLERRGAVDGGGLSDVGAPVPRHTLRLPGSRQGMERPRAPGPALLEPAQGVGGGIRLGMGDDFVVAVDAGTSAKISFPPLRRGGIPVLRSGGRAC